MPLVIITDKVRNKEIMRVNRLVAPGHAERRVPDAATIFTIPAGSSVWYHGFQGH